ncbi:hypothetical protein [Caulobacter sp. DWR2-3-1b2]|uniref:hypothetical protein n=1 Tax=unclassified Caulobacter TaxID=2648921 RepID=UPI003CF49EE1
MGIEKLWDGLPKDALKLALALHPYTRVQVLWQPANTAQFFFIRISVGKPTTYLLLEGRDGQTASLANYDHDFDVVWVGVDRDEWDLSDASHRAKAFPLVRAEAVRRAAGDSE